MHNPERNTFFFVAVVFVSVFSGCASTKINGKNPSSLPACEFLEPITVYNFNSITSADTRRGYDYYHVPHASHSDIGNVIIAVFEYNDNTGNDIGHGMMKGSAVNKLAHTHYRDWDASGYCSLSVVLRDSPSGR